MSKPSVKKYRHNSLIDVTFTQRTAYFKQETAADPYKTLPSKSALKCLLLQNENTPLNNKYINNEKQCLRNIQDKLLGQKRNSLKKAVRNGFKQIKNNYELDNLEKRADSMIQKKMKKMIESCVEKYFMKFVQGQNQLIQNCRIRHQNEINTRLMKIQKGYDDILRTYDNFLVIAQKIKDKVIKPQKYVKKTQIQSIIKRNDAQIDEIRAKLKKIATDLQSLNKSDISLSFEQAKINPIYLKYNQVEQFGIEQLRIVVNNYNENFMQIDQKLQEIYSYFT